MSQQNLDPIHCPSKFNRISHTSDLSAEVHHSRVGEENERVGGREGGEMRELKAEKESERARKKGARETESERQRKK